MAEVMPDAQLSERIDRYLDYLMREWASLPTLAREWDEWDELSRLTFVSDWGVPQDRLAQLRAWVAQGVLRPDQHARFTELMRLVHKNKSLLETLLDDCPVREPIPNRTAEAFNVEDLIWNACC